MPSFQIVLTIQVEEIDPAEGKAPREITVTTEATVEADSWLKALRHQVDRAGL